MALETADRVYVMSKGRIEYDGTPADLRSQQGLMDQLLGV